MKTSQAFIHEYLKLLDSGEEWIITSRNDQTMVINSYSFDEFIPFKLVTHQYRKQCRAYQNRKQYALPNTPKIILVENDKKKDQQLLMLVQRGQFAFQKLVAHFQDTQKGQLQLALQIVTVAQMLQKKYGYFKFTQAMIRASKLPTLLVWISQNEVSNQPQFPIEPFYPINLQKNKKCTQTIATPMKIMILSLFQIFSKRMKNSVIQSIFAQKNEINFQFVKKQLSQAIKEQIGSQYTIATPESDKFRRYTQEKKKKMPQFLINRANTPKEEHKHQTQHHHQQSNKKSALTYLQCQRKVEEMKDMGIKKIGANRIVKGIEAKVEKDHHLLYSLHFNSQNSVKHKQQLNFCSLDHDTKNTQSHNIRVTQPIKSTGIIPFQIHSKKEQKIIVRDSGKSVSTSSANYFSVSGSGKRFNSTFTQGQDDTKVNKACRNNQKKSSQSTQNTSTNIKQIKKDQNNFFKQLNKKQMKVSRIIQEHLQEPQAINQLKLNLSPPRIPSIFHIFNNHTGTEHNLHSPGSQFFNDVDNLLHSGGVSPKLSSEIDNTIESEMQKLLFE